MPELCVFQINAKLKPSYISRCGIFSGEERTIPKEYCEKITLDNLAKLQVQLQSLQLAKVAKNLFRSNKYLGPNATKTWDFLLNRDREIEMPDHDLTEGIESELQGYESNDPQNEIQRDIENDLLPQVNLPEQPTSGHHNTVGAEAPGQITDVYGQTDTEQQFDHTE